MVLEFGLLKSGLFQESEAVGDGLGTSTPQVIIRNAQKTKYSWTELRYDASAGNGGCMLVHSPTKWTQLGAAATRVTSDGGKTWADATSDAALLYLGVVCR